MVDCQREIPCAISTSAMDHLESPPRSQPNQREAQFIRLRDRIEERAARKLLARKFEGTPPGIIFAQYRLPKLVPKQAAGLLHKGIAAFYREHVVLSLCIKTN